MSSLYSKDSHWKICKDNWPYCDWYLLIDFSPRSFASRHLGSFKSFAAYIKRDEEYKQILHEEQYQRLVDQLLDWYRGGSAVEVYQLWASARLRELDRHPGRPLSPKDLIPSELQTWQDKLDSCATYEEAETVVSSGLAKDQSCFHD